MFGLPDERFGEVPAAVYHLEEGATLGPEALHAFLATRLAPFKLPVKYWQVDEPLPRLGTEKVDKRALRERYTAEWQRERG